MKECVIVESVFLKEISIGSIIEKFLLENEEYKEHFEELIREKLNERGALTDDQ
jgi:hypothetical protein